MTCYTVQFARSAIKLVPSQSDLCDAPLLGSASLYFISIYQIDVASNVKFVLQYNMPVAWVVQLIIHLSYLLIQNPLDMWCSLLGRPSWSHYSQIMLRTASWVGFIIFLAFICLLLVRYRCILLCAVQLPPCVSSITICLILQLLVVISFHYNLFYYYCDGSAVFNFLSCQLHYLSQYCDTLC